MRPTESLAQPAAPPGAGWRRALLAALACATVLAIVALRAPHRQGNALFVSDGFGYYVYLPSLIIDRDLDLSNQIARQPDQVRQDFYAIQPQTGRPGNPFQVGCALLWLPFFVAAHAAVALLNGLGMNLTRDGFGLAYELPVYLGSFAYGLAGLYFTWKLLEELWGRAVAGTATALTALATGAAAYLWFEPDMCHVVSLALIALLFYRLHRIHQAQDRRPGAWAVVGALCGLIVAVRATDVFVGAAVAWVAAAAFLDRTSGRLAVRWGELGKCFGAFTAVALACFAPQLIVWQVLYGQPFLVPSSTNYQRMDWLRPDLLGLFFSLKRGLFTWTPVLLPAAAGLLVGLWKGPAPVRYGTLVLALAVYFDSCLPQWWIGCSFSERRLVDYSVVFALGLGCLLSLRPAWASSYAVYGAALGLIAFNWVLMFRYFTHDLPEYGDITWGQLVAETLDFPLRLARRFLSRGAAV